MSALIYLTNAGEIAIVSIVAMAILLLILWASDPESVRLFDAFGYIWRFNRGGSIQNLMGRWIIIPTISIIKTTTVDNGHEIAYWSFDFMWLRKIFYFEVERIDKDLWTQET